jgi:hypothetical protein
MRSVFGVHPTRWCRVAGDSGCEFEVAFVFSDVQHTPERTGLVWPSRCEHQNTKIQWVVSKLRARCTDYIEPFGYFPLSHP